MECEACDKNIAVWSVCVDKKCTTTFGVCDDCFNEHKVCWTSFARMSLACTTKTDLRNRRRKEYTQKTNGLLPDFGV